MSLQSGKLFINSFSRQPVYKQWISHKQSILVQSLSSRNASQNPSVHEKLYSTTSRATSHLQQTPSSSNSQNGATERTNDHNGRNRWGARQSQLLRLQQTPWGDPPSALTKIGERARFSSLATTDAS